MKTMDADAIKSAYQGEFQHRLKGDWKDWRAKYAAHVERVRNATDAEWLTPTFQEALWDSNAISTLGPGVSVTVEGAYQDKDLARSLRGAHRQILSGDIAGRGLFLQRLNDETLKKVQTYNERRPQARLARLLAALFPQDMSCILDRRRLRQVMRLLGLPLSRDGFIASHPILRQNIRDALGGSQSDAEAVDQSIFSWFLWERFADEPEEEGAIPAGPEASIVTNIPRLHLLPANAQRKGLTYVRGNVPVLVAVVRECEQGISRADLINVIQREAPQLKAAGSASSVVSQSLGGLSLITFHGDAYRPSERGLELLSAPDPEQVLQPLLIGRVFGMGHLLLALKDEPNGMSRKPLMQHLASLVPTRKSLWIGGELVSWALAAKLAKRNGDQIILTEDGIAYAEALPENFAEEWRLAPSNEDEASEGVERDHTPELSGADFVPAPWDALRARFSDGDVSSGLILPDGLLAELHAALHASPRKRFVLLAGLSGTGKTSIARAYAEAYCRALNLPDWRQRYAQIAVRPDWTDPSGLLGFVNAISDPPTFQATEALHLLLKADADRARPYFVCLDEMNLARVEHYFAPFLSAMEGEAADLALHGEAEAIDNVEPRIPWPANLFIFGTVNMDESTHPFSDKVLDRAFTFEFWDVDLNAWERRKREAGVAPETVQAVSSLLRDLYGCLYGSRRHFGYRTADEVLAYCIAGLATTPLDKLLDGAVLMKVLPRVRGDDSGPLADTLQGLHGLLEAAKLPRSKAKVLHMQASLERLGQTRFWS